MREFEFRVEQVLPQSRQEVFPFFADAANLTAITPAFLDFRILTPMPIEMREGALIDYALRIHRVPVRWQTRITRWEPPIRFVDEQVRGPYRRWVHEHTFEEREGNTVCRDHVKYAVLGGTLVNRLFVRPDVEKIFRFRRNRLTELFGQCAMKPGARSGGSSQ